jgi:transposase-like protein
MKKPIRKELLDELLTEYANPDDLTGPEGLLKRLTGALVERALQTEMTDHLGYEPGAQEGQGQRQLAQRHGQEDAAHGTGRRHRRGPSRPQRHVRAAAGEEAPALV